VSISLLAIVDAYPAAAVDRVARPLYGGLHESPISPRNPMRFAVAVLVLLAVGVPAAAPRRAAAASTLSRPEDPVVITGADVPSLQGVPPSTIVAFRYLGGWQQVPVQVDERFMQTLQDVYNNVAGLPSNTNISVLVYGDPNTFTGADPNPNVDADDEIALMAKDAGDLAPGGPPPTHAVSGSGVQLTITDPLQPGAIGYLYLFEQDGALDPAAGQSYVSYNFNLLSGDYKATYKLVGTLNTDPAPGNPENSLVSTPYYSHHFSDRWNSDGLNVTAGLSTGVDILDRHKELFLPGYCGRSEDTFDLGSSTFRGEGAFIVNKVGPIRAIRSYVGANSGPNTQREHIFYAQREDVRTFLRVHAIPSVIDFFDYSSAASGMTYYNDLNTGGLTVDGSPDSATLGAITWEMVTGTQGSLVHAASIATDIPGFSYTSYYLDDTTPPDVQCTGDNYAYGSSGVYVNMAIPNTDPGIGGTNHLNTVRTTYYEPPGLTVADAQNLSARASTPLSVSAAAWAPVAVGGRAAQVDPRTLPGGSSRAPIAVTGIVAAALALGTAAALRRRRRTGE
jgi:hypothetical protein